MLRFFYVLCQGYTSLGVSILLVLVRHGDHPDERISLL